MKNENELFPDNISVGKITQEEADDLEEKREPSKPFKKIKEKEEYHPYVSCKNYNKKPIKKPIDQNDFDVTELRDALRRVTK